MAGEDKTEKATPKRRQDERKKGNIFQSKELVVVASLIALFYGFKFLAPMFVSSLSASMRYFISLGTMPTISGSDLQVMFLNGLLYFVVSCAPLLLMSILIAIIITLAQTKLLVSFQSMKPKFNRMNPLSGLKRMVSIRGLVELAKSLIKITVLTVIIFQVFRDELLLMPRMMDMTVIQAMAQTGNIIMKIVQMAAIIFVFVAVADYGYQWWEYEKNLRMSKQEIKEEYKQTEGDPQVKGKIKEKQRQMSRQRMMQNVPAADVVIRNPTHYAIAIKYEPKRNNAPMVIAKGADYIALKIVEIAEAHDIVVTENKALARGLYEAVELDQEIPEKFYRPVAEVLAFVYSIKKKDMMKA